jgi:hypothetical protein
MPKRRGRKSAAQTPAPKSERIKGSAKNPKGSASSEKSASKIQLSEKTITALQNKLKEFKKKSNKNITLNDLKAVYRRGAGAYSSSHRPTITGGFPNSRNAWAMARVNKFLKKASGEKVKAAYVQDDDLMAEGGEINEKNLESAKSFQNESKNPIKRWADAKRELIGNKFGIEGKPIYGNGGNVSEYELNKDLQEFAEKEFYEGEKYSDISVSCDLAKGNCYDISEELYDFLKEKGYKDLSLVEVREPLFDLSDAHYEWKEETEYSDLYHILLKVNDYFIDFTGIQYSKDDIGLKIYTEDQLKKRWGKIEFFNRYGKGGLLAPNGKPSNLTHEQWHLVRTPEFKSWFGDWENDPKNASKVVDENGEPLVV